MLTLALFVSGIVHAVELKDLQLVPWPNQIRLDEQGRKLDYNEKVKVKTTIDKKLEQQLGAEGYQLVVDKKGVQIRAAHDAGLFYGEQTLGQLVQTDADGKEWVPYVQVEDKPAFSWRAYMLDEGRYFKGKEVVKSLIDEMARLKMNVFHWHLTDDVGWRIEIKKYPLLTQVGAWRDSSEIVTWQSGKYDGRPHGGFYTQEEIKEVIRYAADRHITIVPEIEMPGHASSAIAAYPWLGVTKEQIRVPTRFAGDPWTYNVADPKVYAFLEDVIAEVAALFPSEVIHIGGDEVKYDHWKMSPEVKALMEKEGMENYSDVQVYFTNRMSQYVESLGKRMMGWNEIMGLTIHEWSSEENASSDSELAGNAVIHFWKGDVAHMKEALRRGHDVVNSTHSYTYLDYSYESIPVKASYEFDPVPEGIPGEQANRVLGLGCQMWCEWAPTVADVHRQTFPRLAAYAETGWTRPENKDYDRFVRELPRLIQGWKSRGIVPGGE